MKSIGDQAKEFREKNGWSYTRMAEEVTKHNGGEQVGRQKITQLEEAGNRMPQYLHALAKTMGTTADALLCGKGLEPGQPAPLAPPSLAELIKKFSHELQAIKPSSRHFLIAAFNEWAKAPHNWSRLTEQLETLGVDVGLTEPDPLVARAVYIDGVTVVPVSPNGMLIARELTALDGLVQGDQVFAEVHDALIEAKQRYGLNDWPHNNRRQTEVPVVKERRTETTSRPE